jgi:hypothetical protein
VGYCALDRPFQNTPLSYSFWKDTINIDERRLADGKRLRRNLFSRKIHRVV